MHPYVPMPWKHSFQNHWKNLQKLTCCGVCCVSPPTDHYDGTGAIPRGGLARPDAHQPLQPQRCELQRTASNVDVPQLCRTHRTAVKRRQSADSRGPTLRDLALGAHHHRLLFNLKTYRKTARDFAHSVLGGTLVTAGLRITQSLKEHKIIIKHISSLMI